MRRPVIAGNWKMHKTPGDAVALVEALAGLAAEPADADVLVAPPFTALPAVAQSLKGHGIGWPPRT